MESGAEKCWQRVCLVRRTWAVRKMGRWRQRRLVFLSTCPVLQVWKLDVVVMITMVMMKVRELMFIFSETSRHCSEHVGILMHLIRTITL